MASFGVTLIFTMRTILITFIILNFVLINSASAQTKRTFKKLNRQSEKVVLLPYSLDRFWLFEKKGSWGLYSETQEKVLVPPNYDLALPTLEKGLFYIISGQSAGIYSSADQTELLKPGFSNLKFLQDEEGRLYIEDTETVLNEGDGVDDFYAGEFYSERDDTYLLAQSPSSGIWSIGEGLLERDLNLKDENLRKDNVMFYKENDWIHNHTRLEIKKKEHSPGFILTDVMEESGIISAFDKTYRIPSRYYDIRERSTFIRVNKVGELELDYYPPISTLKGMYTLSYRLIGDPQKGHRGGTIRDGGFYFYGNSALKLLDSAGSIVTEIKDSNSRIQGISELNGKYYIASDSYGDQIDVYNQDIYSRDGQFIKLLRFEFESIYKDANSAKVSMIIGPWNEIGENILDLRND